MEFVLGCVLEAGDIHQDKEPDLRELTFSLGRERSVANKGIRIGYILYIKWK